MLDEHDDDDLPVGRLAGLLQDPDLHADIERSDFIRGVHPTTGEQVGIFYGINALSRIIRRGEPEDLMPLDVPVDPETDDVEALCALVEVVKGACCYTRD